MRKIKKPKIGEYVLVTKYSDKDPNDRWYVSTIESITTTISGTTCRVDGSKLDWKHIYRISKEEGEAWLKLNGYIQLRSEAY